MGAEHPELFRDPGAGQQPNPPKPPPPSRLHPPRKTSGKGPGSLKRARNGVRGGRTDPQGRRPGLGFLSVSGQRDRRRSIPGEGWSPAAPAPSPGGTERWSPREPRHRGRGRGALREGSPAPRHELPRKLPGRAPGRGRASRVPPAAPGTAGVASSQTPAPSPSPGGLRTGGVPRPAGRSGAVGAPWGLTSPPNTCKGYGLQTSRRHQLRGRLSWLR